MFHFKKRLKILLSSSLELYIITTIRSILAIDHALITFAIEKFDADHLWALEKNTRAIAFYNRHGFRWTGTKQLEAGTTEYLMELRR